MYTRSFLPPPSTPSSHTVFKGIATEKPVTSQSQMKQYISKCIHVGYMTREIKLRGLYTEGRRHKVYKLCIATDPEAYNRLVL